MNRIAAWVKDGFALLGITLLVLLGVLLLPALALVGRLALPIVLAAAMFGGILLYCVSPQFRRWLQPAVKGH